MVEKENPHVLFVKYTHDVAGFVPFSSTRSQSVTSSASPPALEDESTISKAAKKDDVLYMCNQQIIPRDYHSFYSSLRLEKQSNDPEAMPWKNARGHSRTKTWQSGETMSLAAAAVPAVTKDAVEHLLVRGNSFSYALWSFAPPVPDPGHNLCTKSTAVDSCSKSPV